MPQTNFPLTHLFGMRLLPFLWLRMSVLDKNRRMIFRSYYFCCDVVVPILPTCCWGDVPLCGKPNPPLSQDGYRMPAVALCLVGYLSLAVLKPWPAQDQKTLWHVKLPAFALIGRCIAIRLLIWGGGWWCVWGHCATYRKASSWETAPLSEPHVLKGFVFLQHAPLFNRLQ